MDRAVALRSLYDRINAGDIDGFGDLLADDFVEHETLLGFEPTREGTKAFFRMFIAAFPDLRLEAEEILVSGDKAVARAKATGTHRGEFMGVPATGNRVEVPLIDIIRFGDGGLAYEHWGIFDALGLTQQIGAAPGPPG